MELFKFSGFKCLIAVPPGTIYLPDIDWTCTTVHSHTLPFNPSKLWNKNPCHSEHTRTVRAGTGLKWYALHPSTSTILRMYNIRAITRERLQRHLSLVEKERHDSPITLQRYLRITGRCTTAWIYLYNQYKFWCYDLRQLRILSLNRKAGMGFLMLFTTCS